MGASGIDKELVEGVRRFVRKRLAPHSTAWNRDGHVPDEVFAEMSEMGLFGLLLPEEYGGAGCNLSTFIAAIEEIAAGDGGLSTLIHVHCLGTAMLLARLGSEQQKKNWLGKMASGEVIGAVCLTEPSAGSDLSAITGRATRAQGGWILNANKQFITNGARAGLVIVLAVTDPQAGSHGKSFFLVPKGAPGFTPGKTERKMGQSSSDTAQMHFENCFVPDDMVLGAVGAALPLTMGLLSDGRISVAAQAVGMARAAYELALGYARERTTFGKAIFDHQAVGFRLADMNAQIDMARVYAQHAARLCDEGVECIREASIAKLMAAEMAERVCSDAIQIHGGYGYLNDYRVEQISRDVRVCQIYEGTNDIQRLIIARKIREQQI
ncbi:acyl-CoA dehydrogenase family protein [Ferrovibrio sp.]|uniref:acyl-CoA dehydrogenase family protein n=1 Tax=Ferrovibrio sp. TaxID=1917215 RepID=UPI001B538313|nr:acyl-CoA dehydrogenase family protein [Ferrovibrio sp.]MBP7065704.1 acyl-CoA dehydrogenase family protein [Ferrovibrio sp.]